METWWSRWSERAAHERTARRRRVRLALTGLNAALVIISALAVLALVQANRVADQRELAFSGELAASATAQLPIDPEMSVLLARQAFELRPTGEAQAALRQAPASTARSG